MVVLLYYIYVTVLFSSALLAAYRFRQLDRATRLMACFVFLSLATALAVRYFALKGNNHAVCNISALVAWILICLYFNYSVSSFAATSLGWYMAGGGLVLGLVNILLFQPVQQSASNFLFPECMGICCLSFYSIYRLMLTADDNLKLQRTVHFWIPFILVFYQCGGLWSRVAYSYYTEINEKAVRLMLVLLWTNGILTCTGMAALFYLYPKMSTTHV